MAVVVTTEQDLTLAGLGLGPHVRAFRPYEYTFGGLKFGAGTPYVVESVKGLLGTSASSQDVGIETGPGSIPGLLTADSKTIEIRIKSDRMAGTDVEDHLKILNRAFQIPARNLNVWVGDYRSRGYFTGESMQLQYMRPGWPEPRIIYCRVTKRDITSDYDLASGFIDMTIQLQAPDPISYGFYTTVIQIPSGENIDWEQDGDYADGYAPRVVLHGNLVNPEIKRTYTNFYHPTGRTQKVRYNVSRNGMDIDFRNRLSLPIGTGLTITHDDFWASEPGSIQNFSYSGGAGTRADIYLRSVWL